MKIKHLALSVLLLTTLHSFGQSSQSKNRIISGRVLDHIDKSTLPGASIELNNTQKYTISDQNGHFEFLDIAPGTYTITIHYIGYKSVSQQIELTDQKNLVLDLSLNDDSSLLDNIVIIGDQLKGQAKALNQQLNNSNITNVISADQMGRFPDANIGDALKRVPGITMQNDQGEARDIVIRGLGASLNSVTLNGDRIPSAEGDNRNVQMDLIPADMISSIEVNKTLTPDMDADAIGGSVDLITRASPYGQRISATLAGGYSPIREQGNYTGSFVLADRFIDNKLGVILSGSYNSNNFGSDNVEGAWSKDDFGNTYMNTFEIRKYDVQRVRRSVSAALDYKINENNTIYANAIYNWRDDRENRYRLQYKGIKPVYDQQDNIDHYTGDIRRETKGGNNSRRNKDTRLEDQRIENYALKGEHLISSSLDMDWSVNYSRASEDRPGERYINFENKKALVNANLSNTRSPLVSSPQADNAELFKLKTISENHNFTKESELGAKLNFRIPLSIVKDQKGRLRFGGRLRVKDKHRDNLFYEYQSVNPNFITNLSQGQTSYFSGNNFQAGDQYIPGVFASKEYLGGLDLNNPLAFDKQAIPEEYLSKNYKAKEQIYAGYVRFDQDFNANLSMIIGARVEHTNIDYTANHVLDEDNLVGEIAHKNNYTQVLPNLTLKYHSNDNWIYRAAFTTALARPDYYAIAPYINVSSSDTEIFAGNPNLKATYATNVDLMAEKYFSSIGLLSAGVFYKNLNDFIYTYRTSNFTQEDFNNSFPGQTNPINPTENWTFTQQRNGDNVNLYGVEIALQRQLDFLPTEFLKAFGIYLNYTYTHSKAKGISNEDGDFRENMKLPGAAPHVFNGSISWEKDGFSARVSLNYTSDYIDELGSDAFYDSYYDKQLFLDANMSYKVNSYLRIFAEANNLTNQPLRYYQGSSQHLQQMEYYQPKFNLGLKIDL